MEVTVVVAMEVSLEADNTVAMLAGFRCWK